MLRRFSDLGGCVTATVRAGLLGAVVVAVLALLAAPAFAQAEEGPAVGGRMRDLERNPIEGVQFEVRLDDELVGTGETNADGEWRVEVPEAETIYTVTILTDTLPEGVALRDPDRTTLDNVEVRAGQKNVLFPTGERGPTEPPAWEQLADLAAQGIRLGLVIGLAAVGLSLIFGVTGLTNFAHGELVTFGALMAYFFSVSGFDLPLVVAALLAVLAGALFGSGHELVLMRPLRRRRSGNVSLIVVTIGLGIFLRNLYLLLFEGAQRNYDEFAIQRNVDFGPISLRPKEFWSMAICVVVLLTVAFILQRTRLGTSLRAVADEKDLAEASGIDVDRVILSTWVMCGALAALAGVLPGLTDGLSWDMGFRLLLLMFAAVILGGLGTAYGPIVGGLIIGMVSEMSTYWISPKYRTGVALAVLILAILIRPQGILGRKERIG